MISLNLSHFAYICIYICIYELGAFLNQQKSLASILLVYISYPKKTEE